MTRLVSSETYTSETGSRSYAASLFRFRWRLLLSVGGLVLVMLYFAAPYMLWSYTLYRAGRMVDRALEWPEEQRADRLPELRDPGAAEQALGYLAAAMRWRPDNPQAYRYASYIYAARHDWSAATNEIERARAIAPRNQLITWESALVYEQRSYVSSDDVLPRLRQALQESGYDAGRAMEIGDAAFAIRQFAEAASYYKRALVLKPDAPFDLLFRATTAAALSDDPAASGLIAQLKVLDPSFVIPQVVTSHLIEGGNLRWMTPSGETMTYGTPLPRVSPQDGSGVMQWSGQAQALVQVEATDSYRLEMRVRHGQPAPIKLAIGVDGQQVQSVSLERNDNLWETISLPVSLTAGIHALDVWFLNNAIVDGKDRDAVIEWVRLGRGAQSLDQAIGLGDEARVSYNFVEAAGWYQQALALDSSRPFDLVYRAALMAALSADPAAPGLIAEVQAHDPTFVVPRLDQELRIRGNTLRWVMQIGDAVTFGTPVVPYGDTDTIGVLSWTGQAAALIEVERAGLYRLHIRTQHARPAPVEVAVGVDGRAVQQWRLDQGDNSWQTLTISLPLTAGAHTIDYWFFNNDVVDGLDRDARVEWIELEADTP